MTDLGNIKLLYDKASELKNVTCRTDEKNDENGDIEYYSKTCNDNNTGDFASSVWHNGSKTGVSIKYNDSLYIEGMTNNPDGTLDKTCLRKHGQKVCRDKSGEITKE